MILHTQHSKIILEFPRKNSSNLIKTLHIYLEISSNFNYNFGFAVEKIFEFGHTRKSRCLDILKKFVL